MEVGGSTHTPSASRPTESENVLRMSPLLYDGRIVCCTASPLKKYQYNFLKINGFKNRLKKQESICPIIQILDWIC